IIVTGRSLPRRVCGAALSMANDGLSSGAMSHAVLRTQGLSKRYVRGPRWRNCESFVALSEVELEIASGGTLALVGSSGSGKSTAARCIAQLEKPDSGQIWIDGTELTRLSARELLPFRSRVQMIFQDAATAMNPRFSAAEVIQEPLRIQGRNRSEQWDIAETLMKEVALSRDWLKRSVIEFSGGQRQRLAIARALAVLPRLLILDEALSGLDLSIQAQIANLLLDLQAAHSLTYLLISHDLALVVGLADRISVMSKGRIVESGAISTILRDPSHDETKKLLSAAREANSKLAASIGASV
ncbi:MAG TPA: dipeptide/oligopeptide/nickel ABC transporter ATP-binding protein, partial [Terriglobales bacterium]|nr:dipeptide/oligopeptide/nickel ABC transporter ATP-binding protein [Terriglobales bacterium]